MAKTELQNMDANTSMARPDFLKPNDVRGTEHIGKDDIQMPRLALGQGMSPQVLEGKEGFGVGTIFNSLTENIYGKGPLEFTVIRADKPRWVEFVPREDGGGIKDFNVPANDPRTFFGSNGEPPIATKFYDYVVMLLPSRELIALSLKSTGLKVARQLNALMKLRNAPSFAGKYSLVSVIEKNAKGQYANFKVANAGWVDEETFAFGGSLADSLSGKEIQIHREPGDDDDASFNPDEM